MSENNQKTILFVCEHGSAKSVVAAAHFNRLARERNLDLRAIARGTDPDKEFPPNVLHGLDSDGLRPGDEKPMLLCAEDFKAAERVFAFSDLPGDFVDESRIERWRDTPAVSEDYDRARDAISARILKLMDETETGK